MNMLFTSFAPGIGFLLTLVFGFWLSRFGKPYNGLLFNIHKVIALGTVIVTVMQMYKIHNNLNAQALLIILIVVAGICVVALFASGAFLSIGNLDYTLTKTIHKIALSLATVDMVLATYLLLSVKT